MNKPITLCDRCDIAASCLLNYDGVPCRKNRTVEPTNADRIRAMSGEELAKKMSGLESFALTCGGGWPPEKWLDWLRQEATQKGEGKTNESEM